MKVKRINNRNFKPDDADEEGDDDINHSNS